MKSQLEFCNGNFIFDECFTVPFKKSNDDSVEIPSVSGHLADVFELNINRDQTLHF